MGAKIILPAVAKGKFGCAVGTKVFINGLEITDVMSFGIPNVGPDEILSVTITVPLEDIRYAEE